MTTIEPALARDLNLHGLEASLTTIRKAAGATDEEVRDIIVAAVDSAMINMRRLSALPLNERKQLAGDAPTGAPTSTIPSVTNTTSQPPSVTNTIKHRRRRNAANKTASSMSMRERRGLKGKSTHATRIMTCRGSAEGCQKKAFGNAIYRHEGACEHFKRWQAKERSAQRTHANQAVDKKKKAS